MDKKIVIKENEIRKFHADGYFYISTLNSEIGVIPVTNCFSEEEIEKETPEFKHDCENCMYLGSIFDSSTKYDFYYCNTELETTLIARYGDQGDLYVSGLELADTYPLKIAKELAQLQMKLGIIPYNKKLFNKS